MTTNRNAHKTDNQKKNCARKQCAYTHSQIKNTRGRTYQCCNRILNLDKINTISCFRIATLCFDTAILGGEYFMGDGTQKNRILANSILSLFDGHMLRALSILRDGMITAIFYCLSFLVHQPIRARVGGFFCAVLLLFFFFILFLRRTFFFTRENILSRDVDGTESMYLRKKFEISEFYHYRRKLKECLKSNL